MKIVKSGSKTLIIILIASTLLFQTFVTFSSFAATDVQPPTIPTSLTATNITYTSISLSWAAASDNIGVKGYQVFRDGKKILSTSKNNYTNNYLIPGRKYTYYIRAYDSAGNVSGESSALNTAAKIDSIPPSTPGSLVMSSIAYTSIELSWKPSTDNTSVKGYEIYCSNTKVATTSATVYFCKRLAPGNTYTFYVKAYDDAGNYSIQSNIINATTMSDNTAPSIPCELKTSSTTGTEVILTWLPSSDNVKVQKYDIFCDGVKSGSTSKPSYNGKGLIPGKSYNYAVRAIDYVGNISYMSSPLKITTQKDLAAPTVPTGLNVNKTSGSYVSLKWNASTDNIKVKGYQVFCNGLKILTTTRTSNTVKSPFGLGLDVYWVKAYDLADNVSGSSNKVTVIMLK